MSVDFTDTESELSSLRRQLATARENLRLIHERTSQYVMETDIPLDLIKRERQLIERIAEFEQRVERLGRVPQQMVGSATSLGLGTHPFGPAGDRWRNPKDGKEMVRVPAGKFLYGDDKKEVELPEFWIDKAPVTNAEYARFVAETGHEPPEHWNGKTPPKNITDHPVTYVTWRDATAYAQWAGGRLPTEEEWEKAARGTDGREYPWGEWAEDHCNSMAAGVGDTTPVGKYSPRGDSPYGCVDMAGNVWECTASEYEPGSGLPMVRGGSWFDDQWLARCAFRYWIIPGYFLGAVGLRVVVSLALPSSES